MRLCLLAEASNHHTQRWAKYFVERGDDVLVLSLRPGEIAGARVAVVAPPRLGRAGYLAGVPRVRAAVRAFRPQILHAHYATSYGLLGALADWRPYIVSAWGMDVTWGLAKTPIGFALLRFVFSRADRICATSCFLRDATRPFVGDAAIELTPFGVDTDHFRPGPRAEGPLTIGSARPLWRHYGLDVLIDAFARLRERSARLVIYGDGPDRARLEGLAHDGRVSFPGWVPQPDMPAALRSLDVFAMPTLVREAFGVAAVEAAACGLPVVASNTGGLPEVVADGESGYLVPPGDSVALGARLDELAAAPERRAQFGRSGRQMVLDKYRWRDNAALMERIYATFTGSI